MALDSDGQHALVIARLITTVKEQRSHIAFMYAMLGNKSDAAAIRPESLGPIEGDDAGYFLLEGSILLQSTMPLAQEPQS